MENWLVKIPLIAPEVEAGQFPTQVLFFPRNVSLLPVTPELKHDRPGRSLRPTISPPHAPHREPICATCEQPRPLPGKAIFLLVVEAYGSGGPSRNTPNIFQRRNSSC